MITSIGLLTLITIHNYKFFMCVMRTFKICSLRDFKISNTVLLIIVTMLYLTSP